jgi:hypothetical protein
MTQNDKTYRPDDQYFVSLYQTFTPVSPDTLGQVYDNLQEVVRDARKKVNEGYKKEEE